MDLIENSQPASQWNEALVHMRGALDILDQSNAPADIGSHLDLAVSRLEEALHGKPPTTFVDQLREEMQRLLDTTDTEQLEIAEAEQPEFA
jgi:hypothetical protein